MKQPPARRLQCCCCAWPFSPSSSSADEQSLRDPERNAIFNPHFSIPAGASSTSLPHDNNPRNLPSSSKPEPEPVPAPVELETLPGAKAKVDLELERGRRPEAPAAAARSDSGESSIANHAIDTALRFPSPPRRSVDTGETLEEDAEGIGREEEPPPPTYESAMAGK